MLREPCLPPLPPPLVLLPLLPPLRCFFLLTPPPAQLLLIVSGRLKPLFADEEAMRTSRLMSSGSSCSTASSMSSRRSLPGNPLTAEGGLQGQLPPLAEVPEIAMWLLGVELCSKRP